MLLTARVIINMGRGSNHEPSTFSQLKCTSPTTILFDKKKKEHITLNTIKKKCLDTIKTLTNLQNQ